MEFKYTPSLPLWKNWSMLLRAWKELWEGPRWPLAFEGFKLRRRLVISPNERPTLGLAYLSSRMHSLARRRVMVRDHAWYYNEDKDSNLHLNVSTFPHSIFCLDWPLFLEYLHQDHVTQGEGEREEVCSLLIAVGCSVPAQQCTQQALLPTLCHGEKVCKTQLCAQIHCSPTPLLLSSEEYSSCFLPSHKGKENSNRQVKWIFL